MIRPSSRSGRLFCLLILSVMLAVGVGSCAPQTNVGPNATPIQGYSELTAAQLAKYFNAKGPKNRTYRALVPIDVLAQVFIEEGQALFVRGDIAFAQSLIETGWFNFPDPTPDHYTYVRPWMNNFAGIGAYGNGSCLMSNPDLLRLGVRAQMQHLRNYADPQIKASELTYGFVPRACYDARAFNTFRYKGAAPTWQMLSCKWAGWGYGERVIAKYNEIRVFNGLAPVRNLTLGPGTCS